MLFRGRLECCLIFICDHLLYYMQSFTRPLVTYRVLLSQTWDLYERRELVGLIDTALDGEFDVEEACRFLKVGLLCTQDSPKLRPSMSTVVKMLTGKVEVDNWEITKPGLITDFMDLKVKGPPKTTEPQAKDVTSSYSLPSSADQLDTTILYSESSVGATFTSTYNQSIETREFSP